MRKSCWWRQFQEWFTIKRQLLWTFQVWQQEFSLQPNMFVLCRHSRTWSNKGDVVVETNVMAVLRHHDKTGKRITLLFRFERPFSSKDGMSFLKLNMYLWSTASGSDRWFTISYVCLYILDIMTEINFPTPFSFKSTVKCHPTNAMMMTLLPPFPGIMFCSLDGESIFTSTLSLSYFHFHYRSWKRALIVLKMLSSLLTLDSFSARLSFDGGRLLLILQQKASWWCPFGKQYIYLRMESSWPS